MRRKFLIGIGVFFGSVLLIAIGFYGAFFAFAGMEMNDRLKYEAAYLKGYVAVQKQLYRGETEKAKQTLDFLIDAHVKTLSEFTFLQSSAAVIDIDQTLCKAVALRKEHPRVVTVGAKRDQIDQQLKDWYESVDQYLNSKGQNCT